MRDSVRTTDFDDALRLSMAGDNVNNNVIVMLGGGAKDEDIKKFHKPCTLLVAGDHKGANIQGDWDTDPFWQHVESHNPAAIVVDRGSESWLTIEVAHRIRDFIERKNIPLIVAIREDGKVGNFNYQELVGDEMIYRYAVRSCSDEAFILETELVFMFHRSLQAQQTVQEILRSMPNQTSMIDSNVWENVRKWFLSLGGNNDRFNTAVRKLLRLFLDCSTTKSA